MPNDDGEFGRGHGSLRTSLFLSAIERGSGALIWLIVITRIVDDGYAMRASLGKISAPDPLSLDVARTRTRIKISVHLSAMPAGRRAGRRTALNAVSPLFKRTPKNYFLSFHPCVSCGFFQLRFELNALLYHPPVFMGGRFRFPNADFRMPNDDGEFGKRLESLRTSLF